MFPAVGDIEMKQPGWRLPNELCDEVEQRYHAACADGSFKGSKQEYAAGVLRLGLLGLTLGSELPGPHQ